MSFRLGPNALDNLSKLCWKPIEAKPETGRYKCALAVVENEVFVLGGTGVRSGRNLPFTVEEDLSKVEVYNVEEESWRTFPTEMPIACEGCAAVSKDKKIFVLGGYQRDYLDCVHMLDLETETWHTLPSMRKKRSGCCACIIGNCVIVAGGRNNNSDPLSSAELFDLTTLEWTDLPEMSCERSDGSMAVVGTRAYIFGGHGKMTFHPHKSAEFFDMETRKWTTLPDMPRAFYGYGAVAVEKLIVIVGSRVAGRAECSDVVMVFDTESQTWSDLQRLPTLRARCAVGFVGDQVFVFGGTKQYGDLLNTAVSLNVRDLMMPGVCVPDLPDVLELESQERKAALEKWVEEAKAMKQEYLGEVETEIVRVCKEYSKKKESQEARYKTMQDKLEREHEMKKEELEREYAMKKEKFEKDNATKKADLERDNAMKKGAMEAWYKKRMEIMEHESGVWSDEVDVKMEAVREEIESLENHPPGVKRKCAESDD